MKKIIFISLLLLFILSISASADFIVPNSSFLQVALNNGTAYYYDNEYGDWRNNRLDTFTVPQFKLGNDLRSYSISAGYPAGIRTNGSISSWTYFIPFPITLDPGDTLSFEFFFIRNSFSSGSTYPSQVYFVTNSGRIDLNFSNTVSNNNLTGDYSSNGAVDALYFLNYDGSVFTPGTDFVPNTDGYYPYTMSYKVHYYNSTSSPIYIDKFVVGENTSYLNFTALALAGSNEFGLSPFIENTIVQIGNDIKTSLTQLTNITNQLVALNNKMSELNGKIGSLNNQSNWNQLLDDEDPDYQLEQDLIEQQIEAAEAEVDALNAVLDSYTLPSVTDLNNVNNTGNQNFSDSINNQDVSNLMSAFFQNNFLMSILLVVMSLGTVSYVFFGKRS